jgi:hypothetical protein
LGRRQSTDSADVAHGVDKRVSGEVIDERLAQISPLLNELYHLAKARTRQPEAKIQPGEHIHKKDVRQVGSYIFRSDIAFRRTTLTAFWRRQ